MSLKKVFKTSLEFGFIGFTIPSLFISGSIIQATIRSPYYDWQWAQSELSTMISEVSINTGIIGLGVGAITPFVLPYLKRNNLA